MNLQITTAGTALLNANTGPIVLDMFKLGSAFNYLPAPTDVDIHGSLVFQGTPSVPFIANANLVKYSVFLDYNVETLQFGELGLYIAGTLFALGSATELIDKIQVGETVGNSIRIDVYLSVVGTNYSMWFDLAESNNGFMVASLASPDMLPPSNMATPNMYIIEGADSSQSPMLAYTDRLGLWNFDAYQFITGRQASIIGFDSQSVTIAINDFSEQMIPAFFGQIILEFVTGNIFSICRYVKTVVVSGQQVTIGFNTQLVAFPLVGDQVLLYSRAINTAEPLLPIATASVLGGVKVGNGLTIQADGTLSIDPHDIGLVTSVNGMTGDVIVNAGNLPGLATVAVTGNYNDLNNLPPPFVLPPMSLTVRGGAKLPSSGNLIITNTDVLDLSFPPVKKVNGVLPDANGNVTLSASVIGLVNPTNIPGGADINAFNSAGLFIVTAAALTSITNAPPGDTLDATLEVVPLNVSGMGDTIQRWTTAANIFWRKLTGTTWTAWQKVATQVVATTTSLGVVQIGSGINVTAGVISVPTFVPAIATATTLGQVKIGSGLTVDGTGLITAPGPGIATATTLGTVKIGAGLTIDGTGLLTANFGALPIATATTLGTVKIGTGLTITGAGLLSATAVSDATKLNVVNGTAQGVFLTFNNLGTIATGGAAGFNVATSNVEAATFTGGTVTWTVSGWPASGTYAEIQMELLNAGLSTHTFPAAVHWVNPDGTLTTVFATYMTNQRNTTNFQTSGTDFVVMWSRDGGVTIYARVL